MFRLLLIVLIGFAAWKGYESYQFRQQATAAQVGQSISVPPVASPTSTNFTCDGRKYCSQMTSCAEATYFLKTCPGAKIDGNNDGVPCGRQWCR